MRLQSFLAQFSHFSLTFLSFSSHFSPTFKSVYGHFLLTFAVLAQEKARKEKEKRIEAMKSELDPGELTFTSLLPTFTSLFLTIP